MHVVPGRRPVAEALRARRRLTEIVVSPGASGLDGILAAANAGGVKVRTAARHELDELAGGVLHQGVLAVAPEFAYAHLDVLARSDLVVLLDGVTDPQNLGSIARSAEAAGAGGLVLPRRRSAHVTVAAEKAAAGALSWVRVALVPNIAGALSDLAGAGFWSVGLDGEADATLWDSPLLEGRVALVVGAEGQGLSRLVRERCDGLAAIPLRGRVGSLNASAAAAVALFEVVRRRPAAPPEGE